MALNIFIPNINPLHFTQDGYTPLTQYNSKHLSDFQFQDTIKQWEQYVEWFQPWQKSDPLRLQIHSQISPVEMFIHDSNDDVVYNAAVAQLVPSYFDPTFYVYQLDLDLSIFDEGIYRMKIKFGSPVAATIVSNIFEIKEKFDNTLYIKYKHFKHYADAYFENGWNPVIRIYGNLVMDKPSSSNTIFENQESDMTLLHTRPFSVWKLYTGGPEGIPDFAILKYNIIMGCSDLEIDGRYYTKATDGAAFEEKAEKDYPMRGWAIDLRDKLNRTSKILTVVDENVGQALLGLAVVINVETKGFVNDDVGGSYYEVQDIE